MPNATHISQCTLILTAYGIPLPTPRLTCLVKHKPGRHEPSSVQLVPVAYLHSYLLCGQHHEHEGTTHNSHIRSYALLTHSLTRPLIHH